MLNLNLDAHSLLFDQQLDTNPATQTRLLSALIDRLECGVLACGAQGELYHANNAARRELAAGARLRLAGSRVCAPAPLQNAWYTALHDAAVRQRTRLLNLEGSGDQLPVALVPMQVDGIEAPAAIVVLGRRMVCSPLGLEMLAARHGLTHAERRVLRALVSNCTTKQIAASHGVTMNTVRTQIQSVRDKLGVRSIDALLLRAAELPPITACY